MKNNILKTRAVLMRVSFGMPGEARQDKSLTDEVKTQKHLGERSGRWVKTLYPPEALEPIKQLDNRARAYHDSVTLPFDKGIGILPTSLCMEYAETMRDFASERKALVDGHFLARYDEWREWARAAHNGTFQPELYPGAEAVREKFYMRTEPLPVPDSSHFESTVSLVLGTEAEAVNQRVADATLDAQRELMRRMMEPVAHMAQTLAKDKPRIFETLTGNILRIAELAPKLNLSGDPEIDKFAATMQALAQRHDTDELRTESTARRAAREEAQAVLDRLSGYRF